MPILDCKIKTDLTKNAVMFDLKDRIVTDLWGGNGWWVIADHSIIDTARRLHRLGNATAIDNFWHRLRRDGPKNIAVFQPKVEYAPEAVETPVVESTRNNTVLYACLWAAFAISSFNLLRHLFAID